MFRSAAGFACDALQTSPLARTIILAAFLESALTQLGLYLPLLSALLHPLSSPMSKTCGKCLVEWHAFRLFENGPSR